MMKQKNKITVLIILLTAASVLMQSCGKDNMEYPSSTVSGRFTYQGQQVGLIWTDLGIEAANITPSLFLQQVKGDQPVYGVGDVRIYARHDGSFANEFFDGEYVARTSTNRMPFENFTMTKSIVINGDTELGNIEVVPYWWMKDLATTYNGGVFTATFNITKVSTGTNAKNLQFVAIYLSPTNRPDALSANAGAALTVNAGVNTGGNVVPAAASTGGAVTIRWDLNTLTTLQKQQLRALGGNGTIWASVAVKSNGINDALYSDAIQLQLP
jgi:hypothetical protein